MERVGQRKVKKEQGREKKEKEVFTVIERPLYYWP